MHIPAMRMFFRVLGVLSVSLLPAVVAAQSSPTRAASPSTAAETTTIEAGIKLHDAGKFDDAIAKYRGSTEAQPGEHDRFV